MLRLLTMEISVLGIGVIAFLVCSLTRVRNNKSERNKKMSTFDCFLTMYEKTQRLI